MRLPRTPTCGSYVFRVGSVPSVVGRLRRVDLLLIMTIKPIAVEARYVLDAINLSLDDIGMESF
jgi:hypothetical protein